MNDQKKEPHFCANIIAYHACGTENEMNIQMHMSHRLNQPIENTKNALFLSNHHRTRSNPIIATRSIKKCLCTCMFTANKNPLEISLRYLHFYDSKFLFSYNTLNVCFACLWILYIVSLYLYVFSFRLMLGMSLISPTMYVSCLFAGRLNAKFTLYRKNGTYETVKWSNGVLYC